MRRQLVAVVLWLICGHVLAQPQAEQLAQRLPETTGRERLELLVELTTLSREQDPPAAVAWGSEALELLETVSDDRLKLVLLNSLCFAYLHQAQYREVLPYAEEAERLARALGDKAALADALAGLGHAYHKLTESSQARERLSAAIRLYEELGEKAGLALTLAGRCGVHTNRGDYSQALEDCFRAHDIYEELGDRDGLTTILNSIGLAYWRLGRTAEALQHYQEALDLQQPEGNRALVSRLLNNIGLIYSELGDLKLSLDYLLRSLKIKEEIGDRVGVARRLTNIGFVHIELGELETAREYFHQSIDTARRVGFKRGISFALEGLAEVHRQRGEVSKAIDMLKQAIEIGLEIEELNNVQYAYQKLSKFYAEAGRHDRALAAFQEYEKIKHEIYNRQNSEVIAEMQTRFEADQQQKEIELLEQQQALADLELERQRNIRQALVVGFGLLLAMLLLLFNRYRLKARARSMEEAVAQERAVSARLRAVDKLKDEFLANTSHELRTPLYGMTGLAESLIDGAAGELPAAAKVNLSMIVSSGRRLSHLVGDVLDFSKLRHKSLELDRRPVDLRPLAEVVLTLSRPLVGSKHLELKNAVPPDLPAAYADENRLQQILHNLVGNAVKFTESGSVEVSAAAEDGRLVMRVADTGIGISEPQQERIFEAFEQADASVEREYGGTGLGLAVTRQLVELHGGRIWVESSPGEGSRFFFSLPISSREPDQPAAKAPGVLMPAMEPAAEPPPPDDTVAAPDEAAARVLIVDDEPVNRQVLLNYLSTQNLAVTAASSGKEALRMLLARQFDLVLLDVMMPRMSGYEVCRVLRERRPLEQLPVIFLTAKNQAEDVVTGLALGANDYLTKPISKGELIARVRPHLDLVQVYRNLEGLVTEKVSQIKVLRGLLPICASCKKIRDDEGYWSELELFIDSHSEARFTHGICPDCMRGYLERIDGSTEAS